MKTAVVLGAGGFIGGHLVTRLKNEGYYVKGVDIKSPEFGKSDADEFELMDLRDSRKAKAAVYTKNGWNVAEEVYQLAADMGGAGYIFSKEHDADVMHNSASINLNILEAIKNSTCKKIFYSSSACMYPEHNQLDPNNPNCSEDSAYPANPDSEYGWEKLFSERLYLAYARNYGVNAKIGRFHNIYGPKGSWNNGKEKAPAAICRKVACAPQGGEIEIWGDGEQTRSFLYIDECLEGVRRLMESDWEGPVNIGSDEMVTINQLVDITCEIANKQLVKKHIPGPLGVRGRNSDNRLIHEKLGWKPNAPLKDGITKTYNWILSEVKKSVG
jgi:nucleoside-diphosphate-sugar epimerase